MIRLLIILSIFFIVILFVYSALKGLLKKIFINVKGGYKTEMNESEKNKSKVIYDKNNIVVMKGEAPEQKND
ncbi:MAG: hypothetical protein HZB41_01495 [Ignavibacteriae bacterium]|nr:hypothetical protein [Ignavibacteriota bacterium]